MTAGTCDVTQVDCACRWVQILGKFHLLPKPQLTTLLSLYLMVEKSGPSKFPCRKRAPTPQIITLTLLLRLWDCPLHTWMDLPILPVSVLVSDSLCLPFQNRKPSQPHLAFRCQPSSDSQPCPHISP